MPGKATKAATSAPQPATEESTEPAAAPTKAKAVRSQPAPAAGAAAAEQGDGPAESDEFVPMNRAERRAKGRTKTLPQFPGGRGKVSGGRGPVHTQRNWANRRTG